PVGLDRQVAATATGGPREMAGEARHLVFAVGALAGRDAGAELEPAGLGAAAAHQLGARRPSVEVRVRRVDAVLDEADLPFELGIDDRALDQRLPTHTVVSPLKAPLAVRVAQQREIVALRRRSRAAGQQRWIGVGGPVAVLAADLDRVGDLAVD